MEGQPRLDVVGGAQAQQRRARADLQQVAEGVAGPGDLGSAGFDRGIGQQGLDQTPVRTVVVLRWHAGAEVVVVVGPVESVEPVARVVAVAVHRLAAQRVDAGMEVRHTLAEDIDRHAENLHAGPVLPAGRGRQLVGIDVEQGLVVVVLDVVDDLGRARDITGRLAAVVDVLQRDRGVRARLHQVTADRSGQADLDHVGGPKQVALARATAHCVGVVEQAVDIALVAHQVAATVHGAAAANEVARTVAEGADTRAVEFELRGLAEARVVGDLSEVPAFADQVNGAPGGRIDRALQPLHRLARLVAHQVEAHRVDLVVAGPHHRRVDHQLGHHAVLGGRVVAAGRALDDALRVEAVVVAGHDPVEHRLRVLARSAGVVVDHVHAHPQAGAVQRLHHRAELADAHGAVGRVAGVAALGGVEVERVVAPVEAVGGGVLHHRGLLRVAVGGCSRNGGSGTALLWHARQVEHRQQMHVGHAGSGKAAQVLHASALAFGECQVLATVARADAGIPDREVAHVQLVDRHVGGRDHSIRPRANVPAGGLQCTRVQVGDEAALRIGGQGQRVRIGDAVAHDAHAAHEHLDPVAVVAAARRTAARVRPDAGARIEAHRVDAACG